VIGPVVYAAVYVISCVLLFHVSFCDLSVCISLITPSSFRLSTVSRFTLIESSSNSHLGTESKKRGRELDLNDIDDSSQAFEGFPSGGGYAGKATAY
jgi:hypothetical protein